MTKEKYSEWSKPELVKEIKKLKKRKYGIVWEDKPEEVAKLCKKKLPVLEEDKKKEIKTDENKPVNILIEGDNYHALSVLNYTHKVNIDIIYIDPPYNTGAGGDSFRYNDKIIDSEDSYRHSKWLSFMAKRLNLAKKLLKGSGFIFISIDENEYSQLKLLCDEIFGEKNYRNTIILRRYDKNINRQFMSSGLQSFNVGVEYVLIYSKRSDAKLKPVFREASEERQSKGYWKGFWNDANRPTMRYNILGVTPETGQWKWKKEVSYEAIKNYEEYLAKYSKKLILEEYWKKTGKTKRFIRRKKGSNGKNRGVEHWIHPTSEILRNTNWYDMFASKPIKEEGITFNNPKNPDAIKELLKMSYKSEGIILDFFAGSGTTARSVLDLNKEDGGNRKFILCTNNENNICSEICYPRIKKMILGFTKNSKKHKGLGGNLKHYHTNFVNAEPTDLNKRKMVDKSTEMLCLKEDCFNLIKEGKEFRIFKNNGRYLGIIYDDEGIEPFKKEVKKFNKKFVVYVFSLDESAREEEFEDMAEMVELKPIPAVILNVYKRIFKEV